MASDVATVRAATPAEHAIGFGHSMGGAALVMVEIEHPGSFDALVLFEPIIFGRPFARRDHHLARVAEKRRRRFPSRDAARENFEGKPPFDGWTAAAFEGYLEDGLVGRDGFVELSCPPEFEAEVYRSAAAHGVAGRLADLSCPVTLVVGEDSDTYPDGWLETLAGAIPDCRVVQVTGSHFAPMEQPTEIVEQIEAAASRS
jgi:pimeloyl-ACP methyl ester carboxylesterase